MTPPPPLFHTPLPQIPPSPYLKKWTVPKSFKKIVEQTIAYRKIMHNLKGAKKLRGPEKVPPSKNNLFWHLVFELSMLIQIILFTSAGSTPICEDIGR